LWTRIVSLDQDDEIDIESHEIDEDILTIDDEPDDQPKKGKRQWKPYFYSKDFWETHPNKELDHYVIKHYDLFKLANKATSHRQMFFDKAEAIDIENGDFILDAEHDTELQGRKVRSRGMNPLKKENEIKPSEYRNPTPIGCRRRTRKRRNLSIDEKVAIVHSIIVDLNTMTDVAKEYRVTVACISNLVSVSKKVPGFLREL